MEPDSHSPPPTWPKYLFTIPLWVLSLLWAINDRSFEATITLLASSSTLLGLTLAGGSKAKSFAIGLAVGVALTGLLSVLFFPTQNNNQVIDNNQLIDCADDPRSIRSADELKACTAELDKLKSERNKDAIPKEGIPKNGEEFSPTTTESNRFQFEFHGCFTNGTAGVRCELVIINKSGDRNLSFRASHCELYDEFGNKFLGTKVRISNEDGYWPSQLLIFNVRTQATFWFDGAPPVGKISLLKLVGSGGTALSYRDLTIRNSDLQ